MAIENSTNCSATHHCIDNLVLLDLLHEIDTSFDDRSDSEALSTVSDVQQGLEIVVYGYQLASHSQPTRLRAAQVLTDLATGSQPSCQLPEPYLHTLIDGYQLATMTPIGAALAPMFIRHMLEGDDAL
ncbi:hypothetical protein ABWH74_002708 [Burkholderia vietnamiensis]|uniref:hypothetical protein n=1 Tax=Burkholderia vietnamiensis TaxID=60552 RepID=UPI0015935D64|nr:hypothetical protein [Burkholderia vietnamiensis]WHU92236.1 hypothetical protein P4G95_00230 [Burkholderia vietnamiensis]